MMQLVQLLDGFMYFLLQGSLSTEVKGICDDSRQIESKDVFICIRGKNADGHDYVEEALENGASVIVSQYPLEVQEASDAVFIQTPDTRLAKAQMAAAYYGHPDRKLKLIGITGTKGKTTTAYMLKSILEAADYKTGLIGTIEIFDGINSEKTKNTTPDPLVIYSALDRMVKNNVSHAVMEVSSQGMKQSRTAGLYFDIAMLTNISRDHIGKDEHADMKEYMFYKSLLFRQCGIALVNASDRRTCEALSLYKGRIRGCYYGRGKAWMDAGKIMYRGIATKKGIEFYKKDQMGIQVDIKMPGIFNKKNALMAASAADMLGVDFNMIKKGLKELTVKGRMEMISTKKNIDVIIDYAHNADELEDLLKAVRPMCQGRVICMFGCGGNRSGERRLEMGKISGQLADFTVVTSDNPRNEPADRIIQEIVRGVKCSGGAYKIIEKRLRAIDFCMKYAKVGDIVIFAGKGHEDDQEIEGVFYPMDERSYLAEKYGIRL